MTPAQVNFELTALQLARHAASGGDRAPLMWTRLEAADGSGRAFVCHVRFDDRGPDAALLSSSTPRLISMMMIGSSGSTPRFFLTRRSGGGIEQHGANGSALTQPRHGPLKPFAAQNIVRSSVKG